MASSRPHSGPEMDIRNALDELLIRESIEDTGKTLTRAPHYSMIEVNVGGLDCSALKIEESALQLQEASTEDFSDICSRIVDECRLHSALRHPNLVQFLGVFFPSSNILPLIVSEHLSMSLSNALQRFQDLPDVVCRSMVLDVARGLQYLHSLSPSQPHGNLSANSVLITTNFRAKINYLGICNAVGEMIEDPEALELKDKEGGCDCKTDIHAFGELTVHMITRKRPRRSPSSFSSSLIHQIENVDTRSPFRSLILQCLQKEALSRPTAAELVDEIQAINMSDRLAIHDPGRLLSLLLQKPSTPCNGSPLITSSSVESKMKRLQMDNTRLSAQLKVTQSELRHLRLQQTLLQDDEEEEEEEEEEPVRESANHSNGQQIVNKVETKDQAVQVEILQIHHKRVYVELQKEFADQSLGFSIAGGRGSAPTFQEGDESIYITRIAGNGLAERDDRLRPGDKLIQVNGIDLMHSSQAEAMKVLKEAGEICSMLISREDLFSELSPSTNGLSTRRFTSVRKRIAKGTSKLNPFKLGVAVRCEACSSLPEELCDAQAVLLNNKICVGGHYSKTYSSIYQYDPDTDEWTMLATSPVWFFAMAVVQDKLTVVGGFDPKDQSCTNSLYALNERESNWISSLPDMPTARMHASAVTMGTSLVVAGGRNSSTALTCVEVFSLESLQWYSAHPLLLERSSMKTVLHSGYWYLLGGERQGFATARAVCTPLQSLIDSALHKSGSVSRFKAIPSLPTSHGAMSVLGGTIVCVGGRQGAENTTSAAIFALSADPLSWLEIGELPFPLTNSSAVLLSDEEILVIGGREENGSDSNAVYRVFLEEKMH